MVEMARASEDHVGFARASSTWPDPPRDAHRRQQKGVSDMRKPILTALIAGALSAAPLVAFGQTSTAKAPAKPSSAASQSTPSPSSSKSESTTHSTRGVVK